MPAAAARAPLRPGSSLRDSGRTLTYRRYARETRRDDPRRDPRPAPAARPACSARSRWPAEVADELVVGTVRDVHGAVGRRVLGDRRRRAGGVPGPRAVHDGVSRRGLRGRRGRAARAPPGPAHRGPARRRRPARGHRRGAGSLVAAVNGLIGDRLADEHPDLAIDAGASGRRRRTCRASPAALAAAYPGATADVVVFLHGLGGERRRRGRGTPRSAAAATATGWPPSRAGPRSTCAPTPACRSPRTASRWPACSTTWSPHWPVPTSAGSRWSATRWAG